MLLQYMPLNLRQSVADSHKKSLPCTAKVILMATRFPFSSICVYCGSSSGKDLMYADAAKSLGNLMAQQQISLVYGGGNVGLMGIIADTILAAEGRVIGVIPAFLQDREVGHDGLTELIVTQSMHERKQILADRSDAFIAMPGGFGTMEELCEILTWSQLGLHDHPIGVLNVGGYYDPLLQLFDGMVDKGFLKQDNRNMLQAHANPESLLQLMSDYQPIQVEKWLDKME